MPQILEDIKNYINVYNQISYSEPSSFINASSISNYPCLKPHNRIIKTSFKKKRSDWFYLANETFSKITDLGAKKLDLNNVVFYFEKWRENYRENFIRFINGNSYLFTRQISRFDKRYKKKVEQKLRKLNKVKFDLKLELTLDPKLFFTLKDEFDFIIKNWNRFRNSLRKKYGDFEYLCILEIMRTGRPHLHILLFFWEQETRALLQTKEKKFWEEFYNYLREIWGFGRIKVRKIYNRNNLKALNYVLKYVIKTLDPNKKMNKIYSALLFASNKRLYNLSEYFNKLVNKIEWDKEEEFSNENIKYQYDGIVDEEELKRYCNKKGIPLKDCVYIEIYSNSDFWEFPILFNVR